MAAGDALQRFAGALATVDAQPVTTSEFATSAGQTLACAVTFEDPIPHPDKVSTPVPLSRTAEILLRVWTHPILAEPPTTSAEAEPSSASGAPTPVPGLGDQAEIATLTAGTDKVAVSVRTRLGNLDVNVRTQGLNWSGASGIPPSADSPGLRAELAAGAESIATALLHNLSASLPRETLRPESGTSSPSAASTAPESTTPMAPQQVWDPCTIPEADLTAAGLDPQSEKTSTPFPESKQCRWSGPSYEVAVFTKDSRFTEWAYEVFTQPRPVMVGDRRALLAVPEGVSATPCTLLFDIPQGIDDGIVTGVVEVQVSTETSGNRDAPCTELTHLTVPLTRHFPPGR
ncbi:DUF3558 family protein [Nocardia carnea]|uniref:DUF3558 family protein n=1 Tax=Nocardia carnea TaxID=37328 RepID=UPI002453FDFA|nr:DUF3558 family protein [Nocardia carnea]